MTAATLRPFGPGDLPAAHALTVAFQWPHRLEDWAAMSALGAGIAAEQDGRLVGTAMAWPYGAGHATIGLIGVAPALQGQGLGRRLVQAVLARLEDRTVILHATAAGLPLYESFGFVAGGTVRQYQGIVARAGLAPLPEGCRLRPVGHSDPARLAALDRAATGLQRDGLLAALLAASDAVVLDSADGPAGFALLRRFGRGQVIGPVAAPDAAAAQALIGHFLARHAGGFVRVDVPEAAGLAPWLLGMGLGDAGPAIRMVRGTPPDAGHGGISTFALASQAFG